MVAPESHRRPNGLSADEPATVTDDGLYTPEIKRHSLTKYRLHNRYASIFASAMKNKWPQIAYVGLFAGAGHAQLADTKEIVETPALTVVRQPHPFTDYVYVDHDQRCVNALRARVARTGTSAKTTVIRGDVNDSVEQVRRALPPYSASKGLLSFCFVDPFDLRLRFETIRQLSHLRMDFLVLLMVGVDGRRNFAQYLNDHSSRIGDLIDCANWRDEYRAGRHKVIHFLLGKFDLAMQRLGYLSSADHVHPVTVEGLGVLQYVLAFYSKSELGVRFWRETRATLSPQLGLDF